MGGCEGGGDGRGGRGQFDTSVIPKSLAACRWTGSGIVSEMGGGGREVTEKVFLSIRGRQKSVGGKCL